MHAGQLAQGAWKRHRSGIKHREASERQGSAGRTSKGNGDLKFTASFTANANATAVSSRPLVGRTSVSPRAVLSSRKFRNSRSKRTSSKSSIFFCTIRCLSPQSRWQQKLRRLDHCAGATHCPSQSRPTGACGRLRCKRRIRCGHHSILSGRRR